MPNNVWQSSVRPAPINPAMPTISGRDCVERVVVTDGQTEWVLPCDMLCTGYGLVPETRLAALLGCSIDDGAVRVDAAQRTSVPGVFAAGEPTGIGGAAIALIEGETAGYSSGRRPEGALSRARVASRARRTAHAMARAFELRAELRTMATPDTIVCRCEDVPIGSIDPGAGFRRARLHCRLGMGACQGRVCGDALSWLEGWPSEPPRAPLVPVPLAALGIEQSSAMPTIPAGV
jgi:NADPH-dependent 2,4-dienoyl-CoA reductase/sulfur reductase-like enzyme